MKLKPVKKPTGDPAPTTPNAPKPPKRELCRSKVNKSTSHNSQACLSIPKARLLCWLAISQIGGARYSLLPPYPQAVLVAARSICGSLTSEAYLNSLRQIHAMHATHDGRLALRAVSLDQLVALRACDEVHARGV